MKALLGKKIGMTQILREDGKAVPVTLVQAGPCTVTALRTEDKDGYNAVQLGFGKAKHTNKPQAESFKKANIDAPAFIREIRDIAFDQEATKVGSSFDVDTFELGDKVHVTGTSKGKGFAGTVKRWNFNTSKKTHGGNGNVRRPGSIGSMYPQKVFKGKKMAGHMGHERVTVKNLEIAYVDKENHLVGIKGAVPGPRKGYLIMKGQA